MTKTAPYPKKKIFVSFDFINDQDLKNEIIAFSQNKDANFDITNSSLDPITINSQWNKETRYRVNCCDTLVVLTGEQTSVAPGVQNEIYMAKASRVKIIQLTSDPQNKPHQDAGRVKDFNWENVKSMLG